MKSGAGKLNRLLHRPWRATARPRARSQSTQAAAGLGSLQAGFSLTENLFAAVILAIVLVGMANVLTAYTLNHLHAGDVEFASYLANSQLDAVQKDLATQNSMAYDKAPTDPVNCPYCPRGRVFYLSTESITVTQYFFNNFPLDVVSDNASEMTPVPWPPANITAGVECAPPNDCYLTHTLFARNRFFTGGGAEIGAYPGSGAPMPQVLPSDLVAQGARFAVRYLLFGVPAQVESNLPDLGAYVRPADRLTPANYGNPPLTPPAACPYLIGDSCVNGASASGIVYLYTGTGPDNPAYFQHFISKILEVKVYRILDYLDDLTFYNPAVNRYDHELASASVVLVGRLQLR